MSEPSYPNTEHAGGFVWNGRQFTTVPDGYKHELALGKERLDVLVYESPPDWVATVNSNGHLLMEQSPYRTVAISKLLSTLQKVRQEQSEEIGRICVPVASEWIGVWRGLKFQVESGSTWTCGAPGGTWNLVENSDGWCAWYRGRVSVSGTVSNSPDGALDDLLKRLVFETKCQIEDLREMQRLLEVMDFPRGLDV